MRLKHVISLCVLNQKELPAICRFEMLVLALECLIMCQTMPYEL
jgi:hypothetical protein